MYIVEVKDVLSKKGTSYKVVTGRRQTGETLSMNCFLNWCDIRKDDVIEPSIDKTQYGYTLVNYEMKEMSIKDKVNTYGNKCCSDEEYAHYFDVLKTTIDSINNEELKLVVKNILNEAGDRITTSAAVYHHHTGLYGWIVHTVDVLNKALSLLSVYDLNNIDTDYIIAGSILHDIGKLYTYSTDYMGNTTITSVGKYINHLTLGLIILGKFVDVDSEIGVRLIEIIQSHHGHKEYGAIEEPKTLESYIVSQADMASYKEHLINADTSNTEVGIKSKNPTKFTM